MVCVDNIDMFWTEIGYGHNKRQWPINVTCPLNIVVFETFGIVFKILHCSALKLQKILTKDNLMNLLISQILICQVSISTSKVSV